MSGMLQRDVQSHRHWRIFHQRSSWRSLPSRTGAKSLSGAIREPVGHRSDHGEVLAVGRDSIEEAWLGNETVLSP